MGAHLDSNPHTLVKKRNSSPFHLQILKSPDGVQASNGVRWKVTPQFFKIQVEQARTSFLGECITMMWIRCLLSIQLTQIQRKYKILTLTNLAAKID